VELPAGVTGAEKPVKLMLNTREEVYRDIRDLHFSSVFPVLRQRAKQLQAARSDRQTMDIEQMKEFMLSQLRELQAQHKSLGAHIGACEEVMRRKTRSFEDQLRTEHSLVEGLDMRENLAHIETCLAQQTPALAALRLMCLYSLAQDGVPTAQYTALRTQLLHSHGFHHLTTLGNLSRLGLFSEQASVFSGPSAVAAPAGASGGARQLLDKAAVLGGRQTAHLANKVAQSVSLAARPSAFRTVARKLALIPDSASDSYDLRVPLDAGYVFSGAFIPVCCALLRLLLAEGGWTSAAAEAALKLLPGETERRRQREGETVPRVVLVLMLGGVTMAELAGLQHVARAQQHRLIVLTTAVVTGNSLLESVL